MNGTLKRAAEWEDACAVVRHAGLQPYERPPAKTWDALRACNFLLGHVPPAARVLDAGGAPSHSPVSSWLAHYGFTVDVINPALYGNFATHGGRVRYRRGDATTTDFPDAAFDAVICLSVIEHGVPLSAFFAEMARLLVHGGYLIVSTDFWHEPVHAKGKRAFGADVRVFTPGDVDEMLAGARAHGLFGTAVVDYRCEERVVSWFGLTYTFIDFAVRRWSS